MSMGSWSRCARSSEPCRNCAASWWPRPRPRFALRPRPGGTADRLRLHDRRHRRRARARLPVRGDARLLTARLRRRLPPRAPERLARRPRARVPALRRCARRAAARQRQGAGHPSRPAHPRGRLQRPLPCLLPVLGRPAAGLCALPRADQGEGRARRRLCEGQRHRRARLRILGCVWKRISPTGRGRSPTGASTARSARHRSSVSTEMRRRRCGRSLLARLARISSFCFCGPCPDVEATAHQAFLVEHHRHARRGERGLVLIVAEEPHSRAAR